MAKRKIPTLNETLPRLVPAQFLGIMRDIEALQNGEFFIYGGTFNERKTVQGEELGRCFAYQEELHVADRDYGSEAMSLLEEIYRAGGTATPAMMQCIKELVDPVVPDRAYDGTWLDPENVEKLRAPEIIPDVVIQDNRTPTQKRIDDEKEAAVADALRAVSKGLR